MKVVLRQLVSRAVRLGAIALVAIGVSGVVAGFLGATVGTRFVAGDPPGTRYSATRCADFREYEPGARTCEQAATAHHFGEIVDYRLAAGLLGVGVLGAIGVVRRRTPSLFARDALPAAFEETVAATAFSMAALAMAGVGVDQITAGGAGAGNLISGAFVAAIAALWFARRFLHEMGAPASTGI